MTRAPALITAACVALGCASIATGARATDTACLRLAIEVRDAVDLRQSGATLEDVAAVLGEDAARSEAVAFAWSLPVEHSPSMRLLAPHIVSADVYDLCVWGEQ